MTFTVCFQSYHIARQCAGRVAGDGGVGGCMRGIYAQEIIIYIELIIYEMVVQVHHWILWSAYVVAASEYRINIIKFSRIMRSDRSSHTLAFATTASSAGTVCLFS